MSLETATDSTCAVCRDQTSGFPKRTSSSSFPSLLPRPLPPTTTQSTRRPWLACARYNSRTRPSARGTRAACCMNASSQSLRGRSTTNAVCSGRKSPTGSRICTASPAQKQTIVHESGQLRVVRRGTWRSISSGLRADARSFGELQREAESEKTGAALA